MKFTPPQKESNEEPHERIMTALQKHFMKGSHSKVRESIWGKKPHIQSKFPLGKFHVGDEHTILVERLTQPVVPLLLVLATISSADHKLEAMLHDFYIFLDTKVILNMTSFMYYERHSENKTSCRNSRFMHPYHAHTAFTEQKSRETLTH